MKKELHFSKNSQTYMNNNDSSAICFSHIGQRLNYEDNFFVNGIYLSAELQNQMLDKCSHFIREPKTSKVRLFAISDGMGGHNAGEVASLICVEKLALAQKELQYYNSLDEAVTYLQTVITEINDTVYKQSQMNIDLKGMGATLVLFVLYESNCAVLNIGDSRAYYYHKGSLVQITIDHTEGQRILDLGLLTRKELSGFPAWKNLNRYIGYRQNGYISQADEFYPTLEDGIIMLCSDGISDNVSDMQILDILSSDSNLKTVGKKLIDKATVSHNADNATVILIPLRR